MNESDFCCIKQVTKHIHIPIPLKYISNETVGICAILDGWKKQYVKQLEGVLVNYRKIRLSDRTMAVHTSKTVPECKIIGKFDLFCPSVGEIVKGTINRMSEEHIGCLIEETINVSIHHWKQSSPDLSKFLKIGQKILFEIESFVYNRQIIRVQGKITPECVALMNEVFPNVQSDDASDFVNGFPKSEEGTDGSCELFTDSIAQETSGILNNLIESPKPKKSHKRKQESEDSTMEHVSKKHKSTALNSVSNSSNHVSSADSGFVYDPVENTLEVLDFMKDKKESVSSSEGELKSPKKGKSKKSHKRKQENGDSTMEHVSKKTKSTAPNSISNSSNHVSSADAGFVYDPVGNTLEVLDFIKDKKESVSSSEGELKSPKKGKSKKSHKRKQENGDSTMEHVSKKPKSTAPNSISNSSNHVSSADSRFVYDPVGNTLEVLDFMKDKKESESSREGELKSPKKGESKKKKSKKGKDKTKSRKSKMSATGEIVKKDKKKASKDKKDKKQKKDKTKKEKTKKDKTTKDKTKKDKTKKDKTKKDKTKKKHKKVTIKSESK